MCNRWVTKVKAINTNMPSTSGLVIKTQFDSNKQCPEDKMEDVDKKIANSCEVF